MMIITLPWTIYKAIHFALQISKPEREKRTISFRPMKHLNKGAFSRDLASNPILHCSNPDDPVESYNTALRSAIDDHAPKQTKTVIIRPNTEWYNEDMLRLKREKRKLERRWRNTGNHVHKHIFQAKCREYNTIQYLYFVFRDSPTNTKMKKRKEKEK